MNPALEAKYAKLDRNTDDKQKDSESRIAYEARHRGNKAINSLQYTLDPKPKPGEFTYGDKVVITHNNRYYNEKLHATPRMSETKAKVQRPPLPEPEMLDLNLKNMTLTLSYYVNNMPAPQSLPQPISKTYVSRDEPYMDYKYTGRNTINRVIYSYRAHDKDSAVSALQPIKK
jgi:hypothetical protein